MVYDRVLSELVVETTSRIVLIVIDGLGGTPLKANGQIEV